MFECSICKFTITDPTPFTTSCCNHACCQSCLQRWKTASVNRNCHLCRSPNPSSIAARLQGADELFKEYLRVSGEVEPTTSQAVSSINNNTTTSAFALPNVSVSGSDTSLVELY